MKTLAHVLQLTALAMLALSCHSGNARAELASDGKLPTARASFSDPRDAPVQRAESKIKDQQGRVRFVVDLLDDNTGKPASFVDAASKIAWHQRRSAEQIDAVARLRGIEVVASTALVGTSFVAYLDAKDVDQLLKDKRVAMLTEDAALPLGALWNNTVDPGTNQTRPYGVQALGMPGMQSSGGATVYVLDTGVELHQDLPGLSSSNRLTALATDTNGQSINPTGCYPHATHVAGIIGAGNNSFGAVGVLPGVSLVSVGLGSQNLGSCSRGEIDPFTGYEGYLVSAYVLGLDKIYQRVNQSQRTGIVNLSSNGGAGYYSTTGTIGAKMKVLATPSPLDGGYKGVLIVQSAGNQGTDACGLAYNGNSTYDGILVVGGLDDNGQRVRALNGIAGYSGPDVASNTGVCVDMWAPSQRVLSTWSGNGYSVLAGTSMAAPHVAGFAAALLESDPYIMDSRDLEAAVRNRLVTIVGSQLAMPRWTSAPLVALPTVEIAEGNANKISLTQSGFSVFSEGLNLRFESAGAQSCYAYVTRNGYYFREQYFGASGNLANGFPGGNYHWTVYCLSPQGTQTIATASGIIRRHVSAYWYASTTSTNGQWQLIPNKGVAYWSIAANAPFDQSYASEGADFCEISSYGFRDNLGADQEQNSGWYLAVPPYYSENLLWNSTAYSGYYWPTSFTFGTMYFGNPDIPNAWIGFGPYNGYKWRLTCWNWDGGQYESKSVIMYGQGQ